MQQQKGWLVGVTMVHIYACEHGKETEARCILRKDALLLDVECFGDTSLYTRSLDTGHAKEMAVESTIRYLKVVNDGWFIYAILSCIPTFTSCTCAE